MTTQQNSSPSAVIKPPSIYENLKASVTALWLYSVFLLRLRRALRDTLHQDLAQLSGTLKKIKLTKRFLAGAHLGYLSSRYLLSDHPNISNRVHLLNAEIYGYWGIAIIALDHTVDTQHIDWFRAKSFMENCLQILHTRAIILDADPHPQKGNRVNLSTSAHSAADLDKCAEILATRLFDTLRQKIDTLAGHYSGSSEAASCFMKCKQEFEQRSIQLVAGQLKSLEQFLIDSKHDWSWYCTELLNQKTLNFFFAPISLYLLTPAASSRFHQLQSAFLLVNSAYLHWQLMDDVADLLPDTTNGLVTGPGYLLISQGQLAEQLNSWIEAATEEATDGHKQNLNILESILGATFLLADSFFSPICEPCSYSSLNYTMSDDRLSGPSQVVACAKCALANQPLDLQLSLEQLCERRIVQKDRYMQGMAVGDSGAALRAIMESKVIDRLLRTIHNPKRIEQRQLELAPFQDHRLLNILLVVHRLVNRAYTKAVNVAGVERQTV